MKPNKFCCIKVPENRIVIDCDAENKNGEKTNTLHRETIHASFLDKYVVGTVFETKEDAENVLNAMKALIEERGYATVFNFNNLVGFGNYFRENKDYGWKDLADATVKESEFGWQLYIPQSTKLGD